MNFIKFSILFMYLRFAVTQTLRRACIGMIAFHAAFLIVSLSVTLAQCRPLHKMWDLMGIVQGSCINTTTFFYCKTELFRNVMYYLSGVMITAITQH